MISRVKKGWNGSEILFPVIFGTNSEPNQSWFFNVINRFPVAYPKVIFESRLKSFDSKFSKWSAGTNLKQIRLQIRLIRIRWSVSRNSDFFSDFVWIHGYFVPDFEPDSNRGEYQIHKIDFDSISMNFNSIIPHFNHTMYHF